MLSEGCGRGLVLITGEWLILPAPQSKNKNIWCNIYMYLKTGPTKNLSCLRSKERKAAWRTGDMEFKEESELLFPQGSLGGASLHHLRKDKENHVEGRNIENNPHVSGQIKGNTKKKTLWIKVNNQKYYFPRCNGRTFECCTFRIKYQPSKRANKGKKKKRRTININRLG